MNEWPEWVRFLLAALVAFAFIEAMREARRLR